MYDRFRFQVANRTERAPGQRRSTMYPWQYQPEDDEDVSLDAIKYAPVLTATATDTPPGLFTPEEWARLCALQERLQALAPLDPGAELELDLRRLEFARRLVEQGNLNDGV